MSKIGFPGSPSNGREHNWTGRRRKRKFTFNSSQSRWNIVSGQRTNTGPIIDDAVDVTEFNDATGLVKGFRGIAKTVPTYAGLPTGTDNPPVELKKGDFYFVTGANELYMWTGEDVAGPVSTTSWYGDRAFGGGTGGDVSSSGAYTDIFQFDITTTGNASDFGNLIMSNEAGAGGALSNATTGLIAGGPRNANRVTDIEYITIATPGDAQDFGDLIEANSVVSGIHSGSYGFFVGGDTANGKTDRIQTVVVDTPGTATNFGTLNTPKYGNGLVTNGSRVVQGGGGATADFDIEYWSNASPGNSQDFGDFVGGKREAPTGASAGDRGIFMGGTVGDHTSIEYISIGTTGNATSFGNLAQHPDGGGYAAYFSGSANNATRATNFGGVVSGGSEDIEYITMDTPGNSTDFGNLTRRCYYNYGGSGNAS
jgi:hypothetical protein